MIRSLLLLALLPVICIAQEVTTTFLPSIPLLGGSTDVLPTNTAHCWSASGYVTSVAPGTTENNINAVFHYNTTVQGLLCQFECTGGPGAGKSYTYTLRKNQTDSTTSCSTTGAAPASCSDFVHQTAFAANTDAIDLCATPVGTPNACQAMCTIYIKSAS